MATPIHTVRVPDDLWERAGRAADAKGSDLSAEIRAFLERMARRHERALDSRRVAEGSLSD